MCATTFECLPTHSKIYCCKKCANADPEVKDKQRKALRKVWDEKFNGVHPMTLKEVQVKHKQSMMQNHGVEHALQNALLLDKAKTLKLERYGNLTNIEKIKQTKLLRYGSENYNGHEKRTITKYKTIVDTWKHLTPMFSETEFTGVVNGQYYEFQCNVCSHQFFVNLNNGYIPHCKICSAAIHSINTQSNGEKEIIEFIKSVSDTKLIERDRVILNGRELDIYLPDANLAIEFNGIYWHSQSKLNDIRYHVKKSERCAIRGIRLLHIYDYQWYQKQDIVKSLILSKIGRSTKIFARKCTIKKISSVTKKEFLNTTHLQGNCNSSINLGLYYNDELVAVATFGKSRYDKKFEYELLRFSSKLNTTVVGGFSKLLKHFIKTYQPNNILTYCDRNTSTGNLYLQTGFRLIDVLKPSYFYFKDVNVYSREVFQKHMLKDKLQYFDSALTEYENMQVNGFDRVWDAGNYKFCLTLN
jgi:hypothetical protein